MTVAVEIGLRDRSTTYVVRSGAEVERQPGDGIGGVRGVDDDEHHGERNCRGAQQCAYPRQSGRTPRTDADLHAGSHMAERPCASGTPRAERRKNNCAMNKPKVRACRE